MIDSEAKAQNIAVHKAIEIGYIVSSPLPSAYPRTPPSRKVFASTVSAFYPKFSPASGAILSIPGSIL